MDASAAAWPKKPWRKLSASRRSSRWQPRFSPSASNTTRRWKLPTAATKSQIGWCGSAWPLSKRSGERSRTEFIIERTRLLDRLRGHLNPRQEKALLRMLREGPDGFKGGLSAANYIIIAGASPATATRDLADI